MTAPDDPGPDAVPVVPVSDVVPSYERQGVPVDDNAEPADAGHNENGPGAE